MSYLVEQLPHCDLLRLSLSTGWFVLSARQVVHCFESFFLCFDSLLNARFPRTQCVSDLTLRKIFEIRLDSLPHAPPGRQVVRYLENFRGPTWFFTTRSAGPSGCPILRKFFRSDLILWQSLRRAAGRSERPVVGRHLENFSPGPSWFFHGRVGKSENAWV